MMRRTIATRLIEAKTTIPHFYLTADVDMEAAMEFREQVAQVHGAKLSVNDLVLKACALALRRIPEANASFTEEAIIQHARVDIGMAVAIEDGLITPVIRDADKKTIGQIGTEARELAGRAPRAQAASGGVHRRDVLRVEPGHAGDPRTSPRSSTRPRARSWRSATCARCRSSRTARSSSARRMSITLSCDHRVIDGALGAKLLQAIVGDPREADLAGVLSSLFRKRADRCGEQFEVIA